MESLPVTAIPAVIAAEGQSARDVAPLEAGDLTAFEQALEKEILLIAPENAQTAVDAAALGLTLPLPETTPAADGAQILEAILDSAPCSPRSALPARPLMRTHRIPGSLCVQPCQRTPRFRRTVPG